MNNKIQSIKLNNFERISKKEFSHRDTHKFCSANVFMCMHTYADINKVIHAVLETFLCIRILMTK